MKHRDRGESVYEAERVYGPQYQSATYESILEIDNVRTEHYTTTFRCEAVNKFGAASNDMQVRNCNDVLTYQMVFLKLVHTESQVNHKTQPFWVKVVHLVVPNVQTLAGHVVGTNNYPPF